MLAVSDKKFMLRTEACALNDIPQEIWLVII